MSRYIVIANPRFSKESDPCPALYCRMLYIPEIDIHAEQLQFLQDTKGMEAEEILKYSAKREKENGFVTGLLGNMPKLLLHNSFDVEYDLTKWYSYHQLPAEPFTIVSCHFFIY